MNYKITTSEDIQNTNRSQKTIYWGIPSIDAVSQSNVDLLNKLLQEKGFDYKVKFVGISDSDETYAADVKSYEEKNPLDIVYAGGDNTYFNSFTELVQSGVLECLDSYLASSSGKAIKEYYGDSFWNATEFNQKHYIFPFDFGSGNLGTYIEFNPKYVTKEEVASFDGTFDSLMKLYKGSEAAGKLKINLPGIDLGTLRILTYGSLVSELSCGIMIDSGYKVISYLNNSRLKSTALNMNQAFLDNNIVIAEQDENTDYFAKMTSDFLGDSTSEYRYKYTSLVTSLISSGTGICANSALKDAAFTLVS